MKRQRPLCAVTALAMTAALSFPAQATPARTYSVMCLGDSITDGFYYPGGYRNTLCELLTEHELSDDVDLVGPNWGGDGYDPQHAGYSGYSIDNIAQNDSISGQRTGISSFIDSLLESYPADVICLQIGTNDILSNYDLPHIGDRLDALVGRILPTLPDDGMLYLATLPPMDANNTLYISAQYFTPDSMDECVDDYNAAIRSIVTRRQAAGDPIALAEMDTVVTKELLYDGVHPSVEGYQKMGQYWYDLLSDYLDGEATTTAPPTLLRGDVNEDGTLGIADVLLLERYLVRDATLSSTQAAAADWNGDHVLDGFDAAAILTALQ